MPPGAAASGDDSAPSIPPFWQKLNSFFLFPLQIEPLIYAVLLALLSYGLLGPFFIALLAALGLLLGTSRYAFKVAALASRGVTHSRDYRNSMVDDDWKYLPWKLFGVLLVHSVLIGVLGSVSMPLDMLGRLLSSLVLPATIMVLIQTCSLRAAINPFELLATITGIGWSYLLLCLFLFLLMQGMPLAMALVLPIAPAALLLPLAAFIGVYFSWVMAAMIGYVMYQHHGTLEIEVLQTPEAAAPARPEDPALVQARQRDAEVAALVQAGQMSEALATAREWQRTGFDSLPDQRRYHRVLKLSDQHATLTAHAQGFITLLLRNQRAGEALDVWTSCRRRVPDFAPSSAADTLALAQQAWQQMQPKQTLALLRSFDKRFANDEHIPAAYELIVRVLHQTGQHQEQALRIHSAMQRRYPQHPSTQEVAWVLRDELKAAAGAASPATS